MRTPSAGQVAAVEDPDLLPAVVRGVDPVRRPVRREERMPGALIGVEVMRLPQCRQFPGEPDDRLHFQRHSVGRRIDNEGPVTIDGRVKLEAAGSEERLAPAGAVADDADLSVRVRQAAQVGGSAADIADEALVRDAALGPRRGRGIVRAGAGRVPVVEVRHQGRVAVRGELSRYLLGRGVIAGHVVDHHDAADRAGRVNRAGQVCLDLVTAVPGDADCPCRHRIFHAYCLYLISAPSVAAAPSCQQPRSRRTRPAPSASPARALVGRGRAAAFTARLLAITAAIARGSAEGGISRGGRLSWEQSLPYLRWLSWSWAA